MGYRPQEPDLELLDSGPISITRPPATSTASSLRVFLLWCPGLPSSRSVRIGNWTSRPDFGPYLGRGWFVDISQIAPRFLDTDTCTARLLGLCWSVAAERDPGWAEAAFAELAKGTQIRWGGMDVTARILPVFAGDFGELARVRARFFLDSHLCIDYRRQHPRGVDDTLGTPARWCPNLRGSQYLKEFEPLNGPRVPRTEQPLLSHLHGVPSPPVGFPLCVDSMGRLDDPEARAALRTATVLAPLRVRCEPCIQCGEMLSRKHVGCLMCNEVFCAAVCLKKHTFWCQHFPENVPAMCPLRLVGKPLGGYANPDGSSGWQAQQQVKRAASSLCMRDSLTQRRGGADQVEREPVYGRPLHPDACDARSLHFARAVLPYRPPPLPCQSPRQAGGIWHSTNPCVIEQYASPECVGLPYADSRGAGGSSASSAATFVPTAVVRGKTTEELDDDGLTEASGPGKQAGVQDRAASDVIEAWCTTDAWWASKANFVALELSLIHI